MREKQKEEKKNIKSPNASLGEAIFFFNEDEKFIIWINHMKEKTFSLLCWQHYFVLYWCDDIHITPELYI